MTVAEEVRGIRAALNENTEAFGARWLVSARTVEGWEQGRRRPNALALDGMRKLAARTNGTRGGRPRKKAKG